ncbi:MAG: hypothetical protein KJ737_14085 [Proteobacteria bacterium]|nr:hypothetical protein [Pseudomonadota bacterium]
MKRLLVILSSFVFLCVFTSSALAEWGLYGHARMATWYNMEDEDLSASGEDDVDFSEWLQTNARIGANVTTGDVNGRFEYGTSGGNANIRLLYGSWNFGKGTLLVGQNYTPLDCHMMSNRVYGEDDGFLTIGCPYEGRLAQIQVIIGDLTIAAISPSNTNDLGVDEENGTVDIDTYIPKLEVAYNIKQDNVMATVYGGFNAYKVGYTPTGSTNQHDYELYSGIVGARCMANIGDSYVNVCLFYVMNAANYGFKFDGNADAAEIKDGDVENSASLGGALVIGSKIDDKMAIEAGAGYVQHDVDSAKDPDGTLAVYAQLRYTPIPAVCMVPEVGYVDNMDDETGATEGSKIYVGAKWQINF